MEKILKGKKFFTFEKGLVCFTGILLIMLAVFSCNNIIAIKEGGSLVITLPGARAASASTFTIELTGTSGFNKRETLAGGTTVQFDDLAPDTYTINVKGRDDAGALVLSGTETATVIAGETATVPVKLQNLLGSLTVDFVGAESDSVVEYIVTLSGPNEFKETEKVDDRTIQFEGLIPGDYIVSVEGKNGDDVVLAGTSSKIPVEAGKNAPAKVNLENKLGSLTVNFSGASVSTGTTLTVRLTDSDGVSSEKPSSGEEVYFENLIPGTYNIVVKGMDASDAVVFYGTSSETVKAGETEPADVELIKGVSDFASLEAAVVAGGKVYIFENIDVKSGLTVGTTVEILPAYQNVTLTNNSSENLFTVDTNGNLTIGGGEHTITLNGNQVAKEIIKMSSGTVTLADKGEISNAASTGVSVNGGTFNMTGGSITGNIGSSGGGVNLSSATFNMSGGSISGNTVTGFGGAVSMSSGTFSMTGGSIDNNSSDNRGGGVSVSGGSFNLSGGSITGNSAKNDGDGVYMSSGAFNMSGSAVVDEKNDVYLYNSNPYFNKITITGELTGATTVATITSSSYTSGTQVLQGGDGVDLVAEVSKFAVTPNPDDGSEWIIDTAGILQKGVSDFASLQAAVAAGGTVYVLKNIEVKDTLSPQADNPVTILPAYQDVTLKNTGSGYLFKVTSGTLTIGGGEHTITLDGNQVKSSIIQLEGGTVTLASNGIIRNAASAGVNLPLGNGTFNIDGGTITGNISSSAGGGIILGMGTINMYSGTITGNTSTYLGGGGVAITSSGGFFNFLGGSITGNTAPNGKGVYITSGTLTMSGSAVIASNNDVYLSSSKVITVAGTLSGTTPVATITPSSYTADIQVLSLGNYILEVSKFALTPDPAGSQWTISDTGYLQQVQ